MKCVAWFVKYFRLWLLGRFDGWFRIYQYIYLYPHFLNVKSACWFVKYFRLWLLGRFDGWFSIYQYTYLYPHFTNVKFDAWFVIFYEKKLSFYLWWIQHAHWICAPEVFVKYMKNALWIKKSDACHYIFLPMLCFFNTIF